MNYKTLFEKIKTELASRRSNVKGFTYKFFKEYIKALENQDYSPLYSTYFYDKNGGCYCAFLELIHPYNKRIIEKRCSV